RLPARSPPRHLTIVKPRRVDEIQLGPRILAGPNDVGKRAAMLLREAENEIAPAAYLVEPSGIQLDRRFVLFELAGQRFEPVVRSVVRLLQLGQGRIDLLNRR